MDSKDRKEIKDVTEKKQRKRKETHLPLAEFIYKHSPIKKGLVIKNEDKPLTKCEKIMNKIYLGNYQAAKDRDFFKDKKIKAVLNCTKDIPNHFAHNKDIEYMRIPVEDSLKEKDFDLMYEYFPVIVEFIHKHTVVQGDNTLIHCWAGRQRSAISVAAYLISKHKMTPHDACKYIMVKRKEAFHFGQSLNFDQALNKYYKKIQKNKL